MLSKVHYLTTLFVKFFKLIFSDIRFWIFTVITVPFVLITVINRPSYSDSLRNVVDNLYAAIISTFIIGLIAYLIKFRRYIKIEGNYIPFSYRDVKKEFYVSPNSSESKLFTIVEGGSTTELKETANGTAKLIYKGGDQFSITLTENNQNRWEGTLWFNEIYMADVVWSYVYPSTLINSCGFKKAVVIEGNSLCIYLFSPDNQGYGREVLIKEYS